MEMIFTKQYSGSKKASDILHKSGVHCLIHQPSYSMFNRGIEDGLLEVLKEEGIGCIAYSSLAQGLLTNRYFDGIPADSRAAGKSAFLTENQVTEEKVTLEFFKKFTSDEAIAFFNSTVTRSYEKIGYAPTKLVGYSVDGSVKIVDEFIFQK